MTKVITQEITALELEKEICRELKNFSSEMVYSAKRLLDKIEEVCEGTEIKNNERLVELFLLARKADTFALSMVKDLENSKKNKPVHKPVLRIV